MSGCGACQLFLQEWGITKKVGKADLFMGFELFRVVPDPLAVGTGIVVHAVLFFCALLFAAAAG